MNSRRRVARRFSSPSPTTTHAPFGPTAPYLPGWETTRTPEPSTARTSKPRGGTNPDWLNLSPGYARALSYTYAVLGSYLRERADRDFAMTLTGDHQPPAAVNGEGAS